MLRLALFLGLLTASPLAAQTPQATGTLEGVVMDDAGWTLPGANVKVEGTILGAATNIDGAFRRIEIPAGTYSVTASFAGFAPSTIHGVDVRAGETARLTFELGVAELGDCCFCTYEPPILSPDPFSSRTLSGEELANLPVR